MRRVGALLLSGACAVVVATEAPASAAADPSPGNSVSFQCTTAPPDPQALASCAWHPFPVRVVWSWTNEAGNCGAGGVPLSYDDSGPEVVISADRPPDHDGWYNHPVAFSVSGLDTASGIASCAGNTTYSGPQDRNASVAGSCTDGAGN